MSKLPKVNLDMLKIGGLIVAGLGFILSNEAQKRQVNDAVQENVDEIVDKAIKTYEINRNAREARSREIFNEIGKK